MEQQTQRGKMQTEKLEIYKNEHFQHLVRNEIYYFIRDQIKQQRHRKIRMRTKSQNLIAGMLLIITETLLTEQDLLFAIAKIILRTIIEVFLRN
jgi:hypothetical protein